MFTIETHPKLSVPAAHYDKIKPIVADGLRVCYEFSELAEDPFQPGHFIVPGYSGYSISRTGSLYSRHGAKSLSFHAVKGHGSITGGYSRKRGILRDDGVVASVSRHRLLALTFLPYRGHPDNFWVNHRNGIPGDDRLENLEWVTASENIKHAYRNNLHPNKVRSIDAWHCDSVEPIRLSSITEACELTGLSHSLITGRLRRPDRNGIPTADGWRFKDLKETWAPMEEHPNRTTNQVSVVASNVLDGSVNTYPSISAAAKALGLRTGSIQAHCSRVSKKPLYGFLFKTIN